MLLLDIWMGVLSFHSGTQERREIRCLCLLSASALLALLLLCHACCMHVDVAIGLIIHRVCEPCVGIIDLPRLGHGRGNLGWE